MAVFASVQRRHPDSRFLATTLTIRAALSSVGLSPMAVSAGGVSGSVVEIFPTIFMAALLPPRPYSGTRSGHTDDLWARLFGEAGLAHVPALAAYGPLAQAIERAPPRDLHDLRTAAISAVTADWFAVAAPGSGPSATMFVGHPTELGFILPPRHVCEPAFHAMLQTHWTARAVSLPGLAWF